MKRRTLATTLVTRFALLGAAALALTLGLVGVTTSADAAAVARSRARAALDVASSSAPVHLSAGWNHTCAVTPSGAAKCWGDNTFGQLGDGTTSERHSAVPVVGLSTGTASIHAGTLATCALTDAGAAKCWGDNSYGQLGNSSGMSGFSETPVDVDGLASSVAALAVGSGHACALMVGGQVKCWGFGSFGQLGDGLYTSSDGPVDVTGLPTAIVAIAAGAGHSCALAVDGGVWCWGFNQSGQVGISGVDSVGTPTRVAGLPTGIVAIALGAVHTCVLDDTGAVWCWGDNGRGQSGGLSTAPFSTPLRVSGLAGVSSIASGAYHTCALAAGLISCWGANDFGQLGNGELLDTSEPVEGPVLRSGIAEIGPGGSQSCALRVAGSVWCWGGNTAGQLGNRTTDDSLVPVGVRDFASEVSINDVTIKEGDSGTQQAMFTVSLSESSPKTITVSVGTADGAATSPSDYAGVAVDITFNPGDLSKTVSVDVVGDTLTEGDETFLLLASDADGAVMADDSGTATIRDDDAPMISIADASVAEGDTGSTPAETTVSLSGPSSTTVTVDFSTSDGSATAGDDYVASTGSLAIAPGHTTGVIPVAILGDVVFEGDESFTVTISNPTNATLGDTSATATISDDDLAAVPIPLELGYRHVCAVKGGGAKCWGWNNDGQIGDGTTTERHTAVDVVGLPGGIVAVGAGNIHSCAITAAGVPKCWGNNTFGQLGDSSIEGSATPVGVTGLSSGVAAISLGNLHTCALTSGGTVKCWGSNSSGQVGIPIVDDRAFSMSPVEVAGLPADVTSVSAGGSHTCALSATGAVWCWGLNNAGQLGNGDSGDFVHSATPVQVIGLPGPIKAISAGSAFTCALSTAGAVWCWGANEYGQLGDGSGGALGDFSPAPVPVVGLSSNVAAVSAAFFHACALTTAGGVQCWGANIAGRLGDGTLTNSPVPVNVVGLSSGVSYLAAGGNQTCAMPSPVTIKCWGTNLNGQIGDGTTDPIGRLTPVYVLGYGPELSIDDVTVTEGNSGTTAATFTLTLSEPTIAPVTVQFSTADDTAASPGDYTAAAGTVTFTGGDTVRHATVLVRGDTTFEADETFTVDLSGASAAAIADAHGTGTIRNDDALSARAVRLGAGQSLSCAIKATGAPACWGRNHFGQVGDGTTQDRHEAVPVVGLPANVPAITTWTRHACALTATGSALCWGNNEVGQLGNGVRGEGAFSATPVSVTSPPLAAVSAGSEHTCGLTTLGAVLCWGDNTAGQLGTGTFDEGSTLPVPVSGLSSGVVAIAAGASHTCALTVTDEVLCWGFNAYGNLGDGTKVWRNLPVRVVGLPNDIDQISSGRGHTCAVTSVGAAMCWGDNQNGELGNGDYYDSLVPVVPIGLSSGVAVISAGWSHTCALLDNARVKCWGENLDGQLGNGGTTRSLVPVDVSGLSSITAVATGWDHTCALQGADRAICWGRNQFGEVGDGTAARRLSPVDVRGFGPELSAGDVTLQEGNAGSSDADFTVSLSEASSSPTSVNYATADGSAAAGSDYTAASGTLTFAPGETEKTIAIDVSPDTDFEAIETFVINLSNPTNAAVADGSGVATILNDDDLPVQRASFDAGFGHTCAVTATGGVKCWGNNLSGQLGNGGVGGWLGVGAVDVVNLDGAVGAVSAGSLHTCAVALAGGVQCWGSNGYGQLGDGTSGNGGPMPVHVANLSIGAASVAAGDFHSCAVTKIGGVDCWGSNDHGQLGVAGGDSNIPVAVPGLSGVRTVAAGFAHTCALTSGGGVICWGWNSRGQLGNGTTGAGGATPVPVTGLSSGVTAITAGSEHTCALMTGGAIKCWGSNHFGQLGNDSFADFHSTPVGVSGFSSGAIAVSAGAIHTCAVASGGAVSCWGRNADGQAGSPPPDDIRTPQPVAGLSSGVLDIATGDHHSCALMSNDLIKCWGGGGIGELGRCLPAFLLCGSSSTPVDVLGWASDIVIHDATVAEGSPGVSLATFSVTLTKPSTHQITVDYATADRTATAGSDYDPTSGTLTFAPGDTSENITVNIIGDLAVEPDEVFDVLLSNPVNAPLAWGVGVGTITNDDAAVTVSVDDVSVVEGNVGLTPATFTLTLSEPATETVTVAWSTLGISAFADGDYLGDFGTATFTPGDTSESVTIDVVGDSDNEGDEQFSLRLEAASNASIVDDTGIATIVDDDAATISIDDVSLAEGNSGTTAATFTVSLSEPSVSTITVGYSTLNDSATAGSDYVAATGTLTFLAGDIEESITVDVKGDTIIEPNETFHVVLANPVGASIADPAGLGTIINDDVPSISITDATVTEGNTGLTQAALTVSLSTSMAATVTVHYATSNSSATAPADYTAASGTVTFTPGETAKEIRVGVIGDTLDEANETFAVDLSIPTNATIADTFAIVTITDDDAPPTLSVNDVSLREGDTGSAPVAFTISLSSPSGKTIAVSFRTSSGSASAGGDYTTTSGTATIAAGATSVQVQVPVRGDTIDENNETFNVTLSSPSNATIADGTGVGTIIDDDPKPVITYFQPSIVAILDTVTIRGSGFTGATAVQFIPMGGGPISTPFFQVVNDSKISAIVPPGATTGRVWVTTPNGLAISPVDLLLQPKITAIAPVAGPEGSIVTIYGSGFFGATSVRFGSTPSTPIVVSDTLMMTVVPQGAKSSKIQVITPAGVATSADVFTVIVLPPPPP